MTPFIRIWKKPNSKNVKHTICPKAEESGEVAAGDDGRVRIVFTAGTDNRASDFIVDINAKYMLRLCIDAIDRAPVQTRVPTEEEIKEYIIMKVGG